MTSAEFPDEVPAEDWAEQHTEADPRREDEAVGFQTGPTSSGEANEADRAEQHTEVFLDDEV